MDEASSSILFASFCEASLNNRSQTSPEEQWPGLSLPSEIVTPTDPLLGRQSSPLSGSSKMAITPRPVTWGVTKWQWSSMVLLTLTGMILALLHHVYYTTLNGSIAGSSYKQQWSLNIGTAFAFGVIALLKTATSAAYTQYVWRTAKSKAISLGGLDHLFELTNNPFAFLDWELWSNALFAILIGLLCWILTLGGVAPPGTLTVVASLTETTHTATVKTFDFNQSDPNSFINVAESPFQKLATDVATELSPPISSKPADNSSYSLQFFGPGLSCNQPNSTQQEWFNYFSEAYANDSDTFNSEQFRQIAQVPVFPTSDFGQGFQVYSAFSPQLFVLQSVWDSGVSNVESGVSVNGYTGYNWLPDFPIDCDAEGDALDWPGSCTSYWTGRSPAQFWIYLADEYLVCTGSNASFDISFDYIDGEQIVTQTNVEVLNNLIFDLSTAPAGWYFEAFRALGDLIYGNVSLTLSLTDTAPDYLPARYTLSTLTSSPVLETGLIGCAEFLHTPWFNTSMEVVLRCGGISSIPCPTTVPNAYDFGGNSSMCRNNTIARALEDLMTNITISLLSYPGVTTDINVPVAYRLTKNTYTYNPKPLLISYGLTVFFAILIVLVGLNSLNANGVQHSSSFSSILFTTRNPDLDDMATGLSLGTKTLPKEVRERRLMFGVVGDDDEEGKSMDGSGTHIAFGLDGTVHRLKKGGAYN